MKLKITTVANGIISFEVANPREAVRALVALAAEWVKCVKWEAV